MKNITIGADPELFLEDSKTKKYVSAFGLLPGSKRKPFKVKKGAVQVDGVAFEFNVEPAEDRNTFVENVMTVTEVMSSMVRHKNPDLRLAVTPTVVFDDAYFASLPAQAKLLGCEPDYNAYTEKENESPQTDQPFRTGAGHIHIGWSENESPSDTAHFFDCVSVSKQLDAGLFIPSILWDSDNKRRSLYGKIGNFRPKTYGVEWRPLSNAWVSDPDLVEWVFDASMHSMELLGKGEKLFQNNLINNDLHEIHNGREVTMKDAWEHHKLMINYYGYPALPKEYWMQ